MRQQNPTIIIRLPRRHQGRRQATLSRISLLCFQITLETLEIFPSMAKGTVSRKSAVRYRGASAAAEAASSAPTTTAPTASTTTVTTVGEGTAIKASSPSSAALRASSEVPSMSFVFFAYWIVPLFFLAACSRYGVDTSVGTLPADPPKPGGSTKPKSRVTTPPLVPSKKQAAPSTAPSSPYLDLESWPTSYRSTVAKIQQRRPRWTHGPREIEDKTKETASESPPKPKTPSSDPRRRQMLEKIDQLRHQVASSSADDRIWTKLEFADAMRLYDIQFHDGGSLQQETIDTYGEILQELETRRKAAKEAGQVTNLAVDERVGRVAEELTLDYRLKSIDGLLCAVYTALGKVYFMANMFEKSAEAYTQCIDRISSDYLDAVNGRASTGIVLGEYDQAAKDYLKVIRQDDRRYFPDAFTGIARILETKEDAVEGGWVVVLEVLQPLLDNYTQIMDEIPDDELDQSVALGLKRFHHVMFTYHDRKTKDYGRAWKHLELSHKYKLAVLPDWSSGMEQIKSQQITQIFRPGFWPTGVGSETRTPIFIIGFPRSGSTLLERVLDAHPNIVGTGENSVFNGRLDDIRNQIVEVSVKGQHEQLGPLTKRLAEEVVDEMHSRWERLSANTDGLEEAEPLRLVDKMLTNYFNVGFIHMLYPNAIILHVMREPMDTLFSAYKHEFPSGSLEYTSDVQALTEMYRAYRSVIDHWDRVLPGRIVHVRYEDMVNDMPGMAKAIIAATGMPWDESVLDFHKKKHYVNTMSSTQVRKGVYTSGMKSWMRYEKELGPLRKQIGELADSNIKTTLPGYQAPPPDHSEL